MQNMARSPAGARIDRLCTWAATSAADVELAPELVVERDSVLADQRDARLDSAPASSGADLLALPERVQRDQFALRAIEPESTQFHDLLVVTAFSPGLAAWTRASAGGAHTAGACHRAISPQTANDRAGERLFDQLDSVMWTSSSSQEPESTT